MWFQKDISGKHVFLTGAGSGLGRLLAIRLAKKGALLSLVDINLDGLKETKRQVI
jgi:all-trans-retinol dehydrogenase (NAD+)